MSEEKEKVVVSPTKKRIPFKEGLFIIPNESEKEPYLIASHCKACNSKFFPKRSICQNCARDDFMEVIPLNSKGKLYSHTTVEYDKSAPPGFEIPYAVGFIDLPEGVRVLSLLRGWKPGQLKTGMEMGVIFEKIREDREGNEVIAFRFMPIGE